MINCEMETMFQLFTVEHQKRFIIFIESSPLVFQKKPTNIQVPLEINHKLYYSCHWEQIISQFLNTSIYRYNPGDIIPGVGLVETNHCGLPYPVDGDGNCFPGACYVGGAFYDANTGDHIDDMQQYRKVRT